MGIITISRGSYSMGKAVAEEVAKRLGYAVISRDLLLGASDRFHIPEYKLIRAIHDAPGTLDRFRHSKQAYLAYIRAALAEHAAKDNVVYHGLAGHLLLKDIPGVLKVRITAALEDRVSLEMQREGIGEQAARSILVSDDEQRRKWTQSLYGVDPWDSNLYDLVFRIGSLSMDGVVNFICQAAGCEGFTTSEKTLQRVKDLALACHVKAELVDDFPVAGVSCQHGNVVVYVRNKVRGGSQLHKRFETIRQKHKEIYNIEVHSEKILPSDAV
jgi:cytidylate kinase